MKKMVLFVFIIFIFTLFPICCFGYTNEYFAIDNIEKYTLKEKSNGFSKMYGLVDNEQVENNIYVVVTPYEYEDTNDIYNEQTIEKLANEIQTEAKKANYNISIIEKKLSTVGRKNYQCILLRYKNEDMGIYQKQYTLVSKHYSYSITITANDEKYFLSPVVIDVINNFTINDELKEQNSKANLDKATENGIDGAIKSAIVGGIIVAITLIFNKKKVKRKSRNVLIYKIKHQI